METPYKEEAVFRFGSPSNNVIKTLPETPDLLKLLTPSLLMFSCKKEADMSPIVGTSIFNIKLDDIKPEVETRSSKSRTRRRLISDTANDATDVKYLKNDIQLERLHSNPMFGELTKILAEECLHMQTPTNLMNVTWDAASNHQNRHRNVHAAHLKLQNKFLQYRSDEKFQVGALEIECNYSKEVSKLEIDRYVELSHAKSPEHSNSTHEKFDYYRLQLIDDATRKLVDIVHKCIISIYPKERRGSFEQMSPSPDHQYDSGLSSDDNSVENFVSSQQPQTDVLGMAMVAADVLPDDQIFTKSGYTENSGKDLTEHNFSSTFSDISSLVELFPIQRQDVVLSQHSLQSVNNTPKEQQQRTSVKRKHEHTDSQPLAEEIVTKKARSQQPSSKPRQVTPEATRLLTEWYDNHVQYPYPTEDEVGYLATLTNLSSAQVKKWMANKRVRCFNTLSITGNKHPIKTKLAGKRKTNDSSMTYKQLGEQSRKILSYWYDQHINHPYPSETEKEQLASTAGITVAQVKSWFANRRSRASNRRRQVPNYFLEKFPEYSSHVQMVQVHRDQTRRRQRPQPDMTNYQNCYF